MNTKVIFRVLKSQYLRRTQNVRFPPLRVSHSLLLSLLSYHPNNGKDSLFLLSFPLPLNPNSVKEQRKIPRANLETPEKQSIRPTNETKMKGKQDSQIEQGTSSESGEPKTKQKARHNIVAESNTIGQLIC